MKATFDRRSIGVAVLIVGLAVLLVFLIVFAEVPRPDEVEFTLIQLNDIEDLRPPEKGAGNLSRVAALRRRLRLENPQTYMVLPGDLFNPSPMSNITFDGQAAAGRPMIEATNAAGLDFATFGNHAFDPPARVLRQRVDESEARWLSTNVLRAGVEPRDDGPDPRYADVHPHRIFEVRNAQGARARVALIGLTQATTRRSQDYRIVPFVEAARAEIDRLEGKYDILIALTHLSPTEITRLLEKVRGIHLVLAGGESTASGGRQATGDPTFREVPVYVAEPDARSVWVHRIRFRTAPEGADGSRERTLTIRSRLMSMDQETDFDPRTDEVLRTWDDRFRRGFYYDQGVDPYATVATVPPGLVLDGRSDRIRRGPTKLTRLIAVAMINALRVDLEAPHRDEGWRRDVRGLPRLGLFNSGLVRIDRKLQALRRPADGFPVTPYDINRMVPYRPDPVIRVARMKGSLVRALLRIGSQESGKGAFLQAYNEGGLSLGDFPDQLRPEKDYLVAINDYLIDGNEPAFAFLGTARWLFKMAGWMEVLGEKEGVGKIREAITAALQAGELDKIPTWPPPTDEMAKLRRVPDYSLKTRTAPSVPVFFEPSPDGPFLREPAPISRSAVSPTSPRFIADLEERLVLEDDHHTRLDLARTLLTVDHRNRTAARDLVAGLIGDDADLRASARRFLAELIPSAPDSLVEELLRTMDQADEFTRADLADWLALIDPQSQARARTRPEGH